MLKNYFTVAIRNYFGQKVYSLINTVGLALGIAAFLLIILYIQDELNYEQSFTNNDKIYRLVEDFPMGNYVSYTATVPFPSKNRLVADYPDIENATFIFRPSNWGNSPIVKKGDEEFYEDKFVFAEHNLLKLYNFTFIEGSSTNALKNPDQLILTASASQKYFGQGPALGQTLLFNNRELEIIGVIEDLPLTTHLDFDMICSLETFKAQFPPNSPFFETNWTWPAAWLYFTVPDQATANKIEADLPDFISRHYPEDLKENNLELHLQKANDVHLTSHKEIEFKANSNEEYIYLFTAIGALIIFIAIINFINLATSRSVKRSKEVGIRKVMGAYRELLIGQFIGEAILTCFLAMLVATGLIYLSLPWFNQLTGKAIEFQLFNNPLFYIGLPVIGLVTGLLAGSYPALVLSSYQPSEAIKRNTGRSGAKNYLRKALVISQFVISITLMICIGIVYKQMNYIQDKDLGFNKEQLVNINLNFNQFGSINAFESELLKRSDITAVARLGGSIPGNELIMENSFHKNGDAENGQYMAVMFVSHGFEDLFDLEFIDGHSFQIGNSEDSAGFIINEAAAVQLGLTGQIVGSRLGRSLGNNPTRDGTIIGLVKDFHFRPLYEPMKPLIIMPGGGGSVESVRINSDSPATTIAAIEETWKELFPENPFRYSFVDQNFAQLYAKENQFSKTIQYLSILAVFIACLGLLGLSSYTTENRRKEIGIRKVNGATTFSLVTLLTGEFTTLVAIAFAIALPLSYYFGDLWLSNFAFRTSIGFDVFIIAGILSLALALLTVSYHTFKAARTNPVHTLRTE